MHSTFVSKWLGSSITRSWAVAVAADTRDPKFKYKHRQNLTVNFIIKKRQKERKRDRDWPILKKYHQKLRFFKRWGLPASVSDSVYLSFHPILQSNFCQWWDSNRGSQVTEATAPPAVPQPGWDLFFFFHL